MEVFLQSLVLTIALSGISLVMADTTTYRDSISVEPSGAGNSVITPGALTNTGLMVGTIQSIDSSRNVLRIQDGSGIIREYRVSDASLFHNGSGPDKFSDLKAGDKVSFTATRKNGELMIESLGVTTK